jgi:hypothetical protein
MEGANGEEVGGKERGIKGKRERANGQGWRRWGRSEELRVRGKEQTDKAGRTEGRGEGFIMYMLIGSDNFTNPTFQNAHKYRTIGVNPGDIGIAFIFKGYVQFQSKDTKWITMPGH